MMRYITNTLYIFCSELPQSKRLFSFRVSIFNFRKAFANGNHYYHYTLYACLRCISISTIQHTVDSFKAVEYRFTEMIHWINFLQRLWFKLYWKNDIIQKQNESYSEFGNVISFSFSYQLRINVLLLFCARQKNFFVKKKQHYW